MKPRHTLAFLFFHLLFFSCKDDDNMSNPCEGEVETTAEFEFVDKRMSGQDVYWLPILDTVYNLSSGGGNKVHFRAKSDKMDSYKWRVGSDPRTFTDSVFFLNFEDVEGILDVELSVTNDVLEGCFDGDSGMASLVKSVYLKNIASWEDFPMKGKFRGSNVSEPDHVFTIEFHEYLPDLFNFPDGCNEFQGLPLVMSDRSFAFNTTYSNNCGSPSGIGYLKNGNDTLVIDYEIESEADPNVLETKQFVGVRVE